MDMTSIIASNVTSTQSMSQQIVDLALLRKAMNAQEVSASNLIQTMPQQTPSFGHKLDMKV